MREKMAVWVLEAGRYMMTLFGIPSGPGSFPVLRIYYILWLYISRVYHIRKGSSGVTTQSDGKLAG
jgi:hypothetical protein